MCMYLAQVHPAEAQTGADLVVYFSLARDGRAYKNPVTSFCWFIGLELDIPYEPTVSRLPAPGAPARPSASPTRRRGSGLDLASGCASRPLRGGGGAGAVLGMIVLVRQ